MSSELSISKSPKTKAQAEVNYKVNIIETTADYYGSMESAKSRGKPFGVREILNLFNNDKTELERLKGLSYWVDGKLKDGVSKHCTIGENGEIVGISGKEWINLDGHPNKKIFVIPGNNPPFLTVMATSSGSITYVQVDFSADPHSKARRVIYSSNGTAGKSNELLRTDNTKR